MYVDAVTLGTWSFHGDQTTIDLIAASTNALNGAILARRPDHYRSFTFIGIILMAIIGGIGGGVTRDVILGEPPAAFMNPAYLTLCVGLGVLSATRSPTPRPSSSVRDSSSS